MNLKDFVKQTLVDIVGAINEASEELKGSGATVNPVELKTARNGNPKEFPILHEVEFDVAVLAQEGKEAKGGIGIVVASVCLGFQGRSETNASTHSRIKFKIPLLLPNPKKARPKSPHKS
ncbi:MAG: hypothetical protein PF904_19805 [Kiritimatiellae bacterium]|jgi:hypothetical protein|nr:hypothetical protein [Kiritimatiellia bacterium]